MTLPNIRRTHSAYATFRSRKRGSPTEQRETDKSRTPFQRQGKYAIYDFHVKVIHSRGVSFPHMGMGFVYQRVGLLLVAESQEIGCIWSTLAHSTFSFSKSN